MDLETLLGLAGAVLFPLAVVVLVLWPILVAVIESSKVIRGSVRPSTSFVITDTGQQFGKKIRGTRLPIQFVWVTKGFG